MRILGKNNRVMRRRDEVLEGLFYEGVYYPETDGKPMAENTLQAQWIISLYDNLHILLRGQTALVAADNFWYPVKGSPDIVVAPDIYVALGRPDGVRSSYRQWLEGDVAPQVVFEVLSPSNTEAEMLEKRAFYSKYGAEEFIIINPYLPDFQVFEREAGELRPVDLSEGEWRSPLLGMRLKKTSEGLKASYEDGTPFKTAVEQQEDIELAVAKLESTQLVLESTQEVLEATKESLETAKESLETTKESLAQTQNKLQSAEAEAERLRARLRELGIEL